MCRIKKKQLLTGLRDFKKEGLPLLFTKHQRPGLMAIVRGEAATILRCKPQRVIPTNHHTACCSNLPVLDLHQDIGENPTLFITPFTRIISSNCDPTTCSPMTPVVHYGQDGSPICQTGGLLQTCNGGIKISPVLSTPEIFFQPLSKDQTQETDLHYMNKELVTNMINEASCKKKTSTT